MTCVGVNSISPYVDLLSPEPEEVFCPASPAACAVNSLPCYLIAPHRTACKTGAMGDVAWNPSVLNSGQLTIDASGVHAAWSTAVVAAIRDLNGLFTGNGVNVRLVAAPQGVVTVGVTSGSYTFPVNGSTQTGKLRTDILHGATRAIDYQLGTNISRQHAYIFLPLHPRISPQSPTSREVGEPIMRVMAGHEFLHALGLDAHDPSFNGLFSASWTPNQGTRAAQDTVSPFGSSTKLPPLTLSADTISRLRKLWP